MSKRVSWLPIIAVLLLVAWLGIRSLNTNAIWYDEWSSIYTAVGSYTGPFSWTTFIARKILEPWQPPLHALVLAFWGNSVGWTAFALRSLPLFWGMLTVAWTYRLGYDLTRKSAASLKPSLVGLSAAIAVGASAFFIYYLHELRVYTFYAMFTAFALWSYWRMITTQQTWRTRIIFLLAITGLLYSHYFGLLGLGSLGLYHLIFPRKDRNWRWTLGLMLVAGVLFLPWFYVALHPLPNAQIGGDPILFASALDVGQIISRLLFMFSNGNIVLLGILLYFAVQSRSKAVWLLLFWLVVTVAVAVLGNIWLKIISEIRYLIMVWPVLAVLVGFGVAQLAKQKVTPYIILAIWGAVGIWTVINASPLMVAFHSPDSDTFNNSYANAFRVLPWQTLREVIQAHVQAGDALAYHRPDAVWAIEGVFDYYFYDIPIRRTILESLSGTDKDNEYLTSTLQFMSNAPRVWLAVDKTLPANFRLGTFKEALSQDYVSCGNMFDLPNMQLDLYARIPDSNTSAIGQFGDGVQGYLLESLPLSVSQPVRVLLGWKVASTVAPNTYSFALHIENASGQLVNQVDEGLPGSGYNCQWVQFPSAELPAGEYRVLATVYNWSTGDRLTGKSPAQPEPQDRLLVGTFQVH
ncbi:MAG: glycosyltransferase family 39 protein [Chloroflexota bacterium]